MIIQVNNQKIKITLKSSNEISIFLSKARIENGLTQEDMAERLGISQEAVQKIESCKKKHRIETFMKYADALELDFFETFCEEKVTVSNIT